MSPCAPIADMMDTISGAVGELQQSTDTSGERWPVLRKATIQFSH
jgi:hypothetical protein